MVKVVILQLLLISSASAGVKLKWARTFRNPIYWSVKNAEQTSYFVKGVVQHSSGSVDEVMCRANRREEVLDATSCYNEYQKNKGEYLFQK